RYVVVVCRLIGHFRDNRNRGGVGEIGDLVKLPIIDGGVVILKPWGADDHTEHGFLSTPMYAGLAHRNAIGKLRAPFAITGSASQIFDRAIWIPNAEIASATAAIWDGPVIAKRRSDACEVPRNWNLGDKQD